MMDQSEGKDYSVIQVVTPAYEGQVIQVINGTNCGLTIFPRYKNSTLMVTEIAADRNEMRVSEHPNGWPCKHCHKTFSKHEDRTGACGDVVDNPDLRWKTFYTPMDNLEYAEWLHEQK